MNKRLKIAETYIKLDLVFDEATNARLKRVFDEIISKNKETLDRFGKIDYIIHFDKGSTKAKITLFAFLNTLIFYADLKDSINTIYADLKHVSQLFIDQAKENSELIDQHLIRTERRTGIVGRIRNMLRRIDQLQNNNTLSATERQAQLDKLYQELIDILQLLTLEERQQFIQNLDRNITDNLPIPKPENIGRLQRLYAIRTEIDPK